MNKAKSRNKVIALSAVAVSSVALAAYTATSMAQDSDVKDPTALNLNIDKIDRDTVKISVDNIPETIKSLQLSLEIPSGAKFVSEDTVEWLVKGSESIQKNVRISNQGKYLDILIVSDENLEKDGSKIDICEIDVAALDSIIGGKSNGYQIVPRKNANEASYTYVVTDTNRSKSGSNIENSSKDMLKINTPPTIALKEGTINGAIISNGRIEVLEGYDFNKNFKSFVDASDADGTIEDKDITLEVKVKEDVVKDTLDTTAVGSYSVKIVVTDADGDKAEVSAIVDVKQEEVTEPPTISGVKDEHTIKAGDVFEPMEGVSAKDAKGNPVEVKLSGNYDTTEAGKYTLTYTAKDKWGNTATKTTTLTVIKDEAPKITGVVDQTIEKYDKFDPLEGVEVTDDNDKDIKSKLKVTGEVNNKVAGEYTLSYSVTDSANNTTRAQRKITVVPKVTDGSVINSAPTISGVKDQTIKVGESFDPKAGVTAKDKEEGDLTSKIKIDGKVDTSKVGNYKLTYTVEDSKGAKAKASATITVEKADSPIVPETPENPGTPEIPENPGTPEIPPSISDKLDKDIVEIVTGNGEKDSPLTLEIKKVSVKDLKSFLNDLKELNPLVESVSKDSEYTVYKIKLDNDKSSLFARLFKGFKSNEKIYLEIKVKNTYTDLVSSLNEFAKETNSSIELPQKPSTSNPGVDSDNNNSTNKPGGNNNGNTNSNNSNTTGSGSTGNTGNSKPNGTESEKDDTELEIDDTESTLDDTQPETEDKDSKPNNTESKIDYNNNEENPKSGDSSILAYVAGAIVALGALGAVFIKSRKK